MKPIDRHGVFATKPLRAIFLGLALYGTLAWLPSTAFAASETPIFAFTAYREFKDVAERPIEPSATMIIDAQSRFIALLDQRLQESGDTAEIADVSSKKSLIEALVDDLVLANALLIDVLIESPAVEVESRIVSIHHAMRWKYVLEIEVPDFALEPGTFSKGIPLGVAEELEDNGIDVIYLTNAATADYTAECEAAGVPIPPPMFAEPWVNRESFDGEEFESVAEDPELWVYLSEDSNGKQDGICLALPRYNDENKAKLFGIICLGLETSNACFWDNPAGEYFERGVEVGIENFLGGSDLVANDQGECSNCHAGENPFVIHPEVESFAGISALAQPKEWHRPLVDFSWPQNPGPTNLLDGVASPGDCTSCHRKDDSGRFPELSRDLGAYCRFILRRTASTDRSRIGDPGIESWDDVNGFYRTMPSQQQDQGDSFLAHIAELEDACEEFPATGVVALTDPLPDDPDYISPPIVVDPLYGCADQVAIRATLLDATVFVYVNGVVKASGDAMNPDQFIVDLPEALVAGDSVTATQKLDGALSSASEPVLVRDHSVDFPAGLPAPVISPTLIHECGNVIAVRHVPGAKLTTWVNGGAERTVSTATHWTGLYPGKRPFQEKDKFTSRISFCEDASPVSDAAAAVVAPSPLSTPRIKPSKLYPGQRLVNLKNLEHSARASVSEGAAAPLVSSDLAVSYWSNVDVATPLGRPLAAGDALTARQELCELSFSVSTPDIQKCDDLPPPKIRRPVAENTYVVVTESIPGARIRIFDAVPTELGDGSGTIINLNRPIVAGELLRVIQSLDGCEGEYAYFATASEQDEMTLTATTDNGSSVWGSKGGVIGRNSPLHETATLQVTLMGARDGSIDVCFYDADTGDLIDCDYGIDNGETATVSWNELESGAPHRWFAKGTDVLLRRTTSDTVEFISAPEPRLMLLQIATLLTLLGLRQRHENTRAIPGDEKRL